MKTNTIMLGFVALFLMLFSFSFALAENETVNSSDVPMLISEPPVVNLNATDVGSGKIFWKEVGLWFTFNQEKKMEKDMELAQMRLQQAEFATANNMTQAAENALDAYEKLIARAEKRRALINEGNSTDSRVLRLAAMDQAIFAHQERIQKLSDYLATANLTDEQKAKIQDRLNKAENVTTHLHEVQSEKEDKMKTRLMAERNMTEAEAEAKIEDAKDRADEIVGGARDAWRNFRDEAGARNMTPKDLAEQRRQEFRSEVRNEIKPPRFNRSGIEDSSNDFSNTESSNESESINESNSDSVNETEED